MEFKKKFDIEILDRNKPVILKGRYIFLCNLIFITITYGMLIKTHFASDTYNILFQTSANQHLKLGRIMGYLSSGFLEKAHINASVYQSYFTALFIVMLALLTTILMKLFCGKIENLDIKKVTLVNIGIALNFINVYFLEWFLFPEGILNFTVGLVTLIIAIVFITRNISIKNTIISFVFLCISLNSYQINIGFFIIYSLTYILIKNKFKLNGISFKESGVVIAIGSIASTVNIFTLNILQKFNIVEVTERNANFDIGSIIKNFKILFIKGQSEIWLKGSGFMPKGSILLFGCILLILLIFCIYKNRLNVKSIIYILVVVFINYAIVFAPHLLTNQIWLAPRTIVGFFAFLSSIILIIIMLNTEMKVNNILALSTFVFLLISIFQIQTIVSNNFTNNKIDREYTTLICQKVSEYEQKNNIKIKNIATKNDIAPTYGYYNSVEYIGYDTNIRCLVVPWADVNLINYVSGRMFTKVEMKDEIYNQNFKDKNWDYFNLDEQLIFIGDTAYIMMY